MGHLSVPLQRGLVSAAADELYAHVFRKKNKNLQSDAASFFFAKGETHGYICRIYFIFALTHWICFEVGAAKHFTLFGQTKGKQLIFNSVDMITPGSAVHNALNFSWFGPMPQRRHPLQCSPPALGSEFLQRCLCLGFYAILWPYSLSSFRQKI